VLSMHRNAFKSEKGTKDSLQSEPSSVKSKLWKDVVLNHPEFFRTNDDKTHFALVIRSYFPEEPLPEKPQVKLRGPLSVSETQTLINVAVSLYEKEVEEHKVSGIWIPVIVAFIVLGGQIYNIYSAKNTTKDANKVITVLKDSVEVLNKKVDLLLIKNTQTKK
jgi:hypothetical protein